MKRILGVILVLLLAVSFLTACHQQQEIPPQDWVVANEAEFLAKCAHCNLSFEKYDFGGDTVVYYHQRMIGEAIVEFDSINYQFDKDTGKFKKKLAHWRDDLPETLPPIISKEEAMAIGGGTRAYLVYYDPESPLSLPNPVPEGPCWAVSIYKEFYYPEYNYTATWNVDVIVVDAVTGEIVGHDIPIPGEE